MLKHCVSNGVKFSFILNLI